MQPISWGDVLSWWNTFPLDMRVAIQNSALVVGALLVGKLVGWAVKGALKARGFDEHLRPPWSAATTQTRLSPSDLVGFLCAATVWLVAVWQLAVSNQVADLPTIAYSVLTRMWALAALVIIAGLLSAWIARSLMAVTQSPAIKGRLDALLPVTGSRAEAFSETCSRTASLVVYLAVYLLALTGSTEMVGLSSTAQALQALWQLGLRLVCAGVVLGLGWLGARWVYANPDVVAGQEHTEASQDRVHRYVGLGLLAISILFAISLLSGGAGQAGGTGLVIVVIALLYLLRNHVRDATAGVILQVVILQAHRPRQVTLEGMTLQIRSVGLVLTELALEDETYLRRNSEILRAVLATKPA